MRMPASFPATIEVRPRRTLGEMFALGADRCRRDIGRGFARGGPTSRAVVVTLFGKEEGQVAR